MGKGKPFLERLSMDSDLAGELVPGRPIVEIVSDRRVLIENHLGVIAYSRETIVVKAKFGCIRINGCALELQKMTKDQLVICGTIHAVLLQKRETV